MQSFVGTVFEEDIKYASIPFKWLIASHYRCLIRNFKCRTVVLLSLGCEAGESQRSVRPSSPLHGSCLNHWHAGPRRERHTWHRHRGQEGNHWTCFSHLE